jgi:D-beta-D-heptose 7-phosphate kinase / D-beta-D-heptose 1-phosphate adenosyltransferase
MKARAGGAARGSGTIRGGRGSRGWRDWRAKVMSERRARGALRRARDRSRRVVFTNGCFDLLHVGHVSLLEQAAGLGDLLVVGVNSNRSVRRLKGPGRPIVPLRERMEMLAGLRAVDIVVPFDADTPARLIDRLRPEILVKGADYRRKTIVGRATVEAAGGRVVTLPLQRGRSTSTLIRRALRAARRRR